VRDRTGRDIGTVRLPPRVVVTSVGLDGDGARLATTGARARDGSVVPGVSLWDPRSGSLVRRIDTSAARVAFDPSGDLLVTARAAESTADSWDTTTGRRLSTFTGHTAMVTDIAFDHEGTRVATSSSDGSVRVWDPRSGTEVVALHGPTSASVSGVRFSPDGSRVVSTSRDGVVRVWALTLDELVALARGRLTRGLTDDECRQYLQVSTCPGG
jgi:WD40 repeat protein